MNIGKYIFILLFSMTIMASASSPCVAADSSNIVTSELSENIAAKIKKFRASMKDYDTTNPGAKIWLPEGFWDGPSSSDLGVKMLKMMFGNAADYAYWLVTDNGDSTAPTTSTTRTLATAYGGIMNVLGVLIIFASVGFSTLSFFTKRSVDISYLTPEKEEIASFIALRGVFGTTLSYPMPFLGGMSPLQGFTLAVLIFGLGLSTAMIKFSIPWFLSANTIQYTTSPNIGKVIDAVLTAKTCGITLDTLANLSESSSEISDEDYTTSGVKKVIRFGQDLDDGGTCGSITIGYYNKISSSDGIDYNTFSNNETVQAIISVGEEKLTELWNNAVITNIATNLVKDSMTENALDTYYDQYNALKTSYVTSWVSSIKSTVQAGLSTKLDDGQTAQEKYIDLISDVGFFGLGSFYTSLSERQSEVNQTIAGAYSAIEEPGWSSNNSASGWAASAWASIKNFFKPSDNENTIKETKARLESFLIVANQKKKDKTPEEKFYLAAKSITSGNVAGEWADSARNFIVEKLFYLFQQTENGSTFYNPMLELRRIGNTIQDVAVTISGLSGLNNGGIKGAVKSALSSTFFGKSTGLASKIIGTAVMACFSVGFFLANILPQLPYMMWTIATFSYLSHAIISIIGGGWWGAGFVFGEDRNLSGRGAEGANILLTLFAKPLLMTMSFFLAMMLNTLLGFLVTETIQGATTNAYYGGFNIFSLVGQMIVLIMLLLIGMIKNLSLIWEMSDICQRYLGFRGSVDDRSHDDAVSRVQSMSSTLGGNLTEIMAPKK